MPAEKGPGPNPEREPVVSRYVAVEKLIDVGPGLPAETKARIAALARAVEPYEDFADTFGKGEIEDKIALVEILEQCKVFSPDFLQQFENTGRLIHGMHDKAEKRLHAAVATYGRPPGQPIAPEIRAAEKEHQKLVREADRTMASILSRFQGDHRPLAKAILTEAITASFVRSLEKNIRRNGLAQVVADYAPSGIPMTDNERMHGQTHLTWIKHALAGSKLKPVEYRPTPNDFSIEEKFQFLREAEFMPSEPLGFRLPFNAASGEPGLLALQILDKANAFTLASFVIRVGAIHISGSFSRLTGQLHPPHCTLFTLEEEFRFANAQKYYAFLRETIIRTLFSSWERGRLKEKEYLIIDPKDSEAEPLLESGVVEESITLQTAPQADPPIAPKSPLVPEASAVTSAVEKKQRPGTSSYTWRRVMRALDRYGVRIETGHAHPRLIYEGRTARYLNSSETDTRHIREQLFDALKELGIPREEFQKKLF